VLVGGAVIALVVVEWLSGWRQSRNTHMRAVSDLPKFDLVWGFGRAVGVLIGLIVTNVFLHPVHPHLWDPRSWLTVQWVLKLFG
jgi:hypothetical protein